MTAVDIEPNDRVLVTGAAGWLGREFIAKLRRHRNDVEVLAVGSRRTKIEIEGQPTLFVDPWIPSMVAEWRPTLCLHLAFITRERQAEMTAEEYLARNHQLSERALSMFQIPTLRGFVFASSGAALDSENSDDPYGRLKAQDEVIFMREGGESGIPTVCARVWSLSGAHCTKQRHLLFYSLLSQVTNRQDPITIVSKSLVFRRYMDAGEFLWICLRAAAGGLSETVDSGGELVEAGELCLQMMETLGIRLKVSRRPISELPNEYFSNSPIVERLAMAQSERISPLPAQIRRSLPAVDARLR